MYQALYRKWRPQTFDEVIGQQHVTGTLKNQVRSGRLSHAYLFIGSRGTGKTSCARILAKAVNCEHPEDGNPCGKCPACRGIAEGTVLDVVELDAASNNGVDNVRALREEAVFSPAAVKKRVYIIDEVHMLSTPAFNALLKILEEPPPHLMFILATTELQKVPATILSRCQRHSFRRIDSQTLAAYLQKVAEAESLRLTQDAAELIARLAEGGVRDALSLLDQCSDSASIDADAVYDTVGLAGNRRVAELLEAILRHDTETVLRSFNRMWMDGKNPGGLLGELSALMREVLMLRVAPRGARELLSGGYETAQLQKLAKAMTTEELLCAMNTVQRALNGLRDAPNPRMQAELCLAALCEDAAGDSFASLRARISRLEEELAGGVFAAQGSVCPRPEERSDEEDDEGPAEVFTDEPEKRREDDEEDALDLSAFQEEQPEDSFLQKRADSAAAAAPQTPSSVREEDILGAVRANLEPMMRSLPDDPNKLRASLEGDLLRVEVQQGFFLDRLKGRPAFAAKTAEAVSRLCGRAVRVQLAELKPQQRPTRDLEELRAFPEVRFLSDKETTNTSADRREDHG